MRHKTKKINKETKDKLPKITNGQKQIIKHIYKFRFINTNQFQKLFNHKDPTMVKEWLKDLKDKKYIDTDYKRKDMDKNRISAKYFLTPLGRRFLKDEPGFDIDFLERVYKEKSRTDIFKNHCTEICDMYLFLLSRKEKDEELKFFTESDLTKYYYFPEIELDAYVVLQSGNKIRRFFLHIFKDSDPDWLPRQKLKKYIDYFNENTWQENTNNSPFPGLLFVLPSYRLKKHIFEYSRAVLEKAITVDIHLFLEAKQTIQSGSQKIWQEVK
ncbi:MAG: replication-relaxation family protein [Candidatus Levybacteria bacterium]|nr:replication-relaxation family protein [Candidatus Levybacteria bacterium]